MSFIFHGHCQYCPDGYKNEDIRSSKEKSYNIACYGNERLHHHITKSFDRKRSSAGRKYPKI